jgi:hypothetical protein
VRPVVTLAPAQPVPGELLSGLDPPLVNEPGALAVALARGEDLDAAVSAGLRG